MVFTWNVEAIIVAPRAIPKKMVEAVLPPSTIIKSKDTNVVIKSRVAYRNILHVMRSLMS